MPFCAIQIPTASAKPLAFYLALNPDISIRKMKADLSADEIDALAENVATNQTEYLLTQQPALVEALATGSIKKDEAFKIIYNTIYLFYRPLIAKLIATTSVINDMQSAIPEMLNEIRPAVASLNVLEGFFGSVTSFKEKKEETPNPGLFKP